MNITLGEVQAGGQWVTICGEREGENEVGLPCRDTCWGAGRQGGSM